MIIVLNRILSIRNRERNEAWSSFQSRLTVATVMLICSMVLVSVVALPAEEIVDRSPRYSGGYQRIFIPEPWKEPSRGKKADSSEEKQTSGVLCVSVTFGTNLKSVPWTKISNKRSLIQQLDKGYGFGGRIQQIIEDSFIDTTGKSFRRKYRKHSHFGNCEHSFEPASVMWKVKLSIAKPKKVWHEQKQYKIYQTTLDSIRSNSKFYVSKRFANGETKRVLLRLCSVEETKVSECTSAGSTSLIKTTAPPSPPTPTTITTTKTTTTTTTTYNACLGATRCQNGGTCRSSDTTYYCLCPSGYFGPACEYMGKGTDLSYLEGIINGSVTNYEKTVEQVLNRANWTNMLVVVDVTGSMLPCTASVYKWLQLSYNKLNTIKYYVFFNDGDNKLDSTKVIGSTGGIYGIEATDLNLTLAVMQTAIRNGGGGDSPENDIEAMLYGIKQCPTCTNLIHIADNQATPRDLVLLPNVTMPVKVITCQLGSTPVNPNLLQIASSTGGSLHTLEQDIINLAEIPIDGTITIGSYTYRRTAIGYVQV